MYLVRKSGLSENLYFVITDSVGSFYIHRCSVCGDFTYRQNELNTLQEQFANTEMLAHKTTATIRNDLICSKCITQENNDELGYACVVCLEIYPIG